ncbi:MAG: hypothetical protein ABIA04_05855 [Pseudomonadota bacterium]
MKKQLANIIFLGLVYLFFWNSLLAQIPYNPHNFNLGLHKVQVLPLSEFNPNDPLIDIVYNASDPIHEEYKVVYYYDSRIIIYATYPFMYFQDTKRKSFNPRFIN